MENKNLKSLIEGCKKGNVKCQNDLYCNYTQVIKSVAYKYYRDSHTVDDIIQETFIKIFNVIHKYDYKGSFDGWVKKITKNLIMDRFRKKIVDLDYDEYCGDKYFSYEDDNNYDFSKDEKLLDIIDASNHLSKSYGLVFNMYFIDGLSHKEISNKLNINEGTSKSNLHKAKKYIIDRLKNKSY